MKYELKFQEIIQQKGILKLIHVTRKDNLKSILKHREPLGAAVQNLDSNF